MKNDIERIKMKKDCIDMFKDSIVDKTEQIEIIQKYIENIPVPTRQQIICENQIKSLQIWIKKHKTAILQYEIEILEIEMNCIKLKKI